MRYNSLLTCRSLVIALALLCLAAAAAEAGGRTQSEFRMRLGQFEPDGKSEFWDTQFQDFTGDIGDFDDFTLGVDYIWSLGNSSALMFGFGYYDSETTQAYHDWTDTEGVPIRHATSLQTSELTVAWLFRFGRDRGRVTPYAGVGAGFVWWQLEESGDFIDFGDSELPVVFAVYRAEGSAKEVFVVAGLDFRLSYFWSFFVEGRWKDVDDELGDDYGGFGEIDLGGTEFNAGVSFRF